MTSSYTKCKDRPYSMILTQRCLQCNPTRFGSCNEERNESPIPPNKLEVRLIFKTDDVVAKLIARLELVLTLLMVKSATKTITIRLLNSASNTGKRCTRIQCARLTEDEGQG